MTHWLAGSSSENCRANVADGDDDGVGDWASGDWPTVATSAVGPAVVAVGEGDAAEGTADDAGAAGGAAGVQAARTVSPAPAARKRAKLRRVAGPHS
jgi:hypothetical protein